MPFHMSNSFACLDVSIIKYIQYVVSEMSEKVLQCTQKFLNMLRRFIKQLSKLNLVGNNSSIPWNSPLKRARNLSRTASVSLSHRFLLFCLHELLFKQTTKNIKLTNAIYFFYILSIVNFYSQTTGQLKVGRILAKMFP